MRETPDPTRHPASHQALHPSVHPARTVPRAGTVIECDACAMQCTPTCDDCVVTYVLRADDVQTEPLTFDIAEERVVRLLAQAGMLPALQYRLAV